MSFDVTDDLTLDLSALFAPIINPGVGFLPEDGGTSGIIVDNVSQDPQASSIYFTPLG